MPYAATHAGDSDSYVGMFSNPCLFKKKKKAQLFKILA